MAWFCYISVYNHGCIIVQSRFKLSWFHCRGSGSYWKVGVQMCALVHKASPHLHYISWFNHGFILIQSLFNHEHIIFLSWLLYDLIILKSWLYVSWLNHGFIIVQSWFYHGCIWFDHGLIMVASWLGHGSIMVQSQLAQKCFVEGSGYTGAAFKKWKLYCTCTANLKIAAPRST